MSGNGFNTIDIAISGMRAHGKQMELISSNVANARTIDDGKGEPYRRVEALFKSAENGGVEVEDTVTDMAEFSRIHSPGNPAADAQGFVAMPNVNLPVELMNLNIATRTYQANVAVLKRYQRMVETSLELLR